MTEVLKKVESLRVLAKKEVEELVELISDVEKLYGEFPAVKNAYVDIFRHLEREVLKLQPTTQHEFWCKNYLAAVLQDLAQSVKGLYVCLFTTSNFHENPKQVAKIHKGCIKGTLHKLEFLKREMTKTVYIIPDGASKEQMQTVEYVELEKRVNNL